MSQPTAEAKTESNESIGCQQPRSAEEERLAGLQGKVVGEFLRLTRWDEGTPVYLRSRDISMYFDSHSATPSCFISGLGFRGCSVKETAEDIDALIAMREGEYTASELGESLIALLVAGGMGAAEARALLSTGPREKLAAGVVKLADELQRITGNAELLGDFQREWRALVNAGEQLAKASGKHRRFLFSKPAPATIECINEAIERLQSTAATPDAVTYRQHFPALRAVIRCLFVDLGINDDPAHGLPELAAGLREARTKIHDLRARADSSGMRAMLADESGKRSQLMDACDQVLRTVGISSDDFDEEAKHGLDDHGAMVRLLGEAKKRHEHTVDEALDMHGKTIALERQVNELIHLKEGVSDRLSRRLDDALRQLPKAVQDDLAKVWAVREAAEVQS